MIWPFRKRIESPFAQKFGHGNPTLERAFRRTNAARDQRWADTPEDQRWLGEGLPGHLFEGVKVRMMCARLEPRPKGYYVYSYWPDAWLVRADA